MKKTWKNQTEATEALVGKTFKVTHLGNSAGLPKGETFVCSAVSYGATTYLYYDNWNAGIQHTHCEEVDLSKEALEQQIAKYEENIDNIKLKISETKSKIKFMVENKLKSFDAEQWKVYRVLEVVENSSTKLEKAKAIAELIKNS